MATAFGGKALAWPRIVETTSTMSNRAGESSFRREGVLAMMLRPAANDAAEVSGKQFRLRIAKHCH
jgi:hypothetical protein